MTPPRRSPGNAFATVDFDRPGRQAGFVMFPHSPHEDAWGVTRLPIGIIANGTGPTVIMEGGNHGDEYEGSITISELIRDLDPAEVNGRLILMPSNNVHACTAARRTSPVDGINLNRAFPGDPTGTITQQIAAYLTDVIFPMGDAFLDLHSGGSSLQILPSAIIEPVADPAHYARNVAAVRAFGAPNTVIIGNLGDPRTATATACRAGMTTVGTEMRGGGTVSLDALDICRRGVRNVLAHLGMIAPTGPAPQDAGDILDLPGPAAYVYATDDGVFEPFHDLGARVSAGQPAGRVHRPWDTAFAPVTLHYGLDGIVFGRRHLGRVAPGNCVLVVAAPARGLPAQLAGGTA
jgi:N-alpha-acetyl-L-2,4-diaminobutyrate deacetylase